MIMNFEVKKRGVKNLIHSGQIVSIHPILQVYFRDTVN
jgi:hypothetical protein